ncbi:hypothetical protein FTUN_6241 [Frigoriglobus tundricola]|uniref:Uncharacterized protein n=1 Tax=Frigoriglobus tundricola TaxID=2774151 RepID=A0A6M5YYX1_9BACT|nr:hypothetical protein FTUN_6241 [Frigoriglobus tundricola]
MKWNAVYGAVGSPIPTQKWPCGIVRSPGWANRERVSSDQRTGHVRTRSSINWYSDVSNTADCFTQSPKVLSDTVTPARPIRATWRCSGRWSRNFPTRTSANKPGPHSPLSIGPTVLGVAVRIRSSARTVGGTVGTRTSCGSCAARSTGSGRNRVARSGSGRCTRGRHHSPSSGARRGSDRGPCRGVRGAPGVANGRGRGAASRVRRRGPSVASVCVRTAGRTGASWPGPTSPSRPRPRHARSSMVRWNCSAWRWSCVRRSAFSAWRARTIPWRVSTSVGSGASESMPKDGSGRAGAQVGFGRFRATITGETFGRRVVDAVEDHGELGGGEFEFAVGRGGEVVPPALESLAPQAEPVAGPVQGLEPVGRAIGENEQMPAQGIGLKRGLDVAVQAVEPEAQIDGPAVPELGGGWNAQHGRPSTACTRAAMTSGRASTGNRRTVPDGNTTSIGGPAGDGVRRMGTSVGVTGTGDGAWSARVRRHT